MNAARLIEEFRGRFGAKPRSFRAPGRVNLIGEHTDHSEGFVMPAAIDLAAWTAIAPAADRRVEVVSLNLNKSFAFSLDDAARPTRSWSDYVQGVAVMLEKAGFCLAGAKLMIDSDVPLGAGLSSSAALEVSMAYALLANAGLEAEPRQVARICQRAENEFVGTKCGIMDQLTSCLGRQDHAIMLDCRTLESWALPLPGEAALIACNTMVTHNLASSEYNARRSDCEAAARQLGIPFLRDISLTEFARRAPELCDRIRKRARHVVTENARVLEAASALRAGDLDSFGQAMNESHRSLKHDYEVSCAELDLMTELARQQPGVYGARMMGGGFGGCTINLVNINHAPSFIISVATAYEEATGIKPDLYFCQLSEGANEVPRDW